QEKTAEVIVALESMKGMLLSSEANAKLNQWGVMTPDRRSIMAIMNYFPRIYPRFTEILQLIGASGLVMLPSQTDFDSENRGDLDKYMQAANSEAYDRVKKFRLAWDACMTSFGTRQTQYERYFYGDPIRLAGKIYQDYDRQALVDRIQSFLDDK
ncbi:MAG TPA: 4-hydroxyphenylacetate 3-hydroxylase C-terminal domain-containing protein, partial [Bacillales bacterium]|nr:4-hydroxyphenylacetate 3-hydroxylase C-terminal domain-containing protein [Bacillales bacterium]